MSDAAAPSGLPPAEGATRLLSDEGLVRRATEGDRRAFAAIFRRYHQDLYRFCLAIVGNSQDSQDALQNTMVKVMGALPDERRRIQLKPWLYRIAHNESIELLRGRKRADQLDPELAALGPQPPEQAEQRARLRRLVADMEELPDRQRGALVMRELAGLGFDQIGAALDTTSAVARQTLYEARLSLRQMEEGRELSCDSVTRALSDADGRVTRRRDVRAHLRSCQSCRDFRDELRRRRSDFAALAPLPAAAAAGILQGIVGAHASGGGLLGTLGGGAGQLLGTSAVAKSVATVAVVAAVGVSAADRGGLIDVGLPGGGGSKAVPASSEESAGAARGGGAVAPARSSRAKGGAVGGRVTPRAAERGLDSGAAAAAPAAAENAGGAAQEDVPSGSPGASAAHRNDAGRHGAPPSSSAPGQQTAASHKGGKEAGGGQVKEHPVRPPKPPHPTPPPSPGGQKPAAPEAPDGNRSPAVPTPVEPETSGGGRLP
ncbi:MAG: RNA polymerase sigma factor [Solirubrobacterales bacterium]